MKKQRIGIFGGTFNPPHNGHVASADSFIKEMSLDKLLVIPTFVPPHKLYDSKVTCEERFEMCELAFSAIDKASVSDIEIKRGGTSYTYITLQELSDDNVELFLLCGTDMMLSIDTWKNPDVIFSLANVCYVRRESDSEKSRQLEDKIKEYVTKFNASVYPIDNSVIDVSSTEVRGNIDSLRDSIPESVYEYISKKGLYK